jgi:hypothetical protein
MSKSMIEQTERGGPGTAKELATAFARIGSIDIPYTRGGNGAAVLLIAARGVLRERLRVSLAESFRVFVPEIGGRWRGLGGADCLPELIDCLGLARAHLVVVGARGIAALHFAISDPHRIDKLVILWRERTDRGPSSAVLEDRLCRADHPLLVQRLGVGEPAELAAIAGFLRAG